MHNRPRILTWHIHGSYLYYLTKTNCDFFIPVKDGHSEGYSGVPKGNFPWGENVHEVAAEKVKELAVNIILFQSKKNYIEDQYEILSKKQHRLPKLYLEHDPPRETPTDTKHIVDNPDMFLVHVTNFNNLFWDNNQTPTTVIHHGVAVPENVKYTGIVNKGIVVVNNFSKRGRRVGLDIVEKVKKYIPLDIIGMNSIDVGGLGEIPHQQIPPFISQYRFFFNPMRYTSLGLAVCEAMMVGLPIIALPTTEMPEIIKNGKDGFMSNDIDVIIEKMQILLQDRDYALSLSTHVKNTAHQKFDIHRFIKEWEEIFLLMMQKDKKKSSRYTVSQTLGGSL